MTKKIDASRALVAGSVSGANLSAGAKQSVLESKLVGFRRGVLTFASTAASSDVVTTEVEAASLVDTPQTSLTAGEGIYTGAVASAIDPKKVIIRAAGTDNGIADGLDDEIYGVLSEALGVYTLSYKKSDGSAFTFGGVVSLDFYFVEIQDLHSLSAEAMLMQAITGVVDATQAATLGGHLNGGASKHDATEVDFELADGSKQVIQAASDDVELALIDLDLYLGNHVQVSGVAKTATHLGTFTGSTIADSSSIKVALQALETSLELKADSSVVTEIDGNVNDLITLSGVAENAADLGTFTGSTIADASTVKAALQALETSLELKADSSVVTEIDGNVNDLITLSGVAENAVNLGTFTGSTIADSSTVKSALQALESAVEGVTSESLQREVFTLSGTNITNKYVDLAFVPATLAAVQLFWVTPGNIKQSYTLDFIVKSDGSDNKRLSWAAADTTTGMEADLIATDVIEVYYTK